MLFLFASLSLKASPVNSNPTLDKALAQYCHLQKKMFSVHIFNTATNSLTSISIRKKDM